MNAPRYGTKAWISRLPPGVRAVARLSGLIVVRFEDGSFGKVVGGTPESPSVVALSPADLASLLPAAPAPTIGFDADITWPDWYNTSASPAEQSVFDDVTKQIDQLGMEALPGGSEENIIETYRYSRPTIYPALKNYRDTGGRRALFAKNAKSYSAQPVSKVAPGGPIETLGAQTILHPGRYTFSDAMYENPKAGLFKNWLDAAIRDRKAQTLRTQVGQGVLANVPLLSVASTPYYIDYEFLVAADVAWNNSIPGLPTWIPAGVDVKSYWGAPAPGAKPDFDALRRAGAGLLDFGQNLTTLALVIGAGYLLMAFGSRVRESKAQHA